MNWLAVGLLACFAIAGWSQTGARKRIEPGWPEYGGTLEGQRYSAAAQINRRNVAQLRQVWSLDVRQYEGDRPRGSFEATPVLWRGALFLTTPKDVVLAVDATTGKVLWTFDPGVKDADVHYIGTSRGVAVWHDRHGGATCSDRVLVATLDRRLIALDARTSATCKGFGNAGAVDLSVGLYLPNKDYLYYTSPPVVVGDRVILGSSIADNQNIDTPSGAVRAFDVRSGKPLWEWEPLASVNGPGPHKSGAGNAWAPLAADAEHDLVFVPTSSPSVDYFGGMRPGDNRDADSIVALRASTGEKVWAFQLVHHDLWDYDTASQPLLFMWHRKVPAVAVMNKTGMIYVFNRLNGEALFPIEERSVPQSDIAGEQTWPTQPFSAVEPLLSMQFKVDQMAATDASDQDFCERLMKDVRYEGPFTPPSMAGTVIYPASLGGPNWGSGAFDPTTGVMYVRVNSMAYLVWLSEGAPKGAEKSSTSPRDQLKSGLFRPPDAALGGGGMLMGGTPYAVNMAALVGPNGTPCGGAPYGRVVATDLNTGKQVWSVTHGRMAGRAGSIGMGGPVVTAGGLVFVGASRDAFLRAYDAATGRELWEGQLRAPATGTPMTYLVKRRQFLVVATGSDDGKQPDRLVAFGLK
ncbi:MAG TPA: pyrroloquinoline quinone-dependent dehydrogenase [Acidobacteriaceae bacterium]|nr:pyrroloquinoline quinone-dependent dehydrogenase [Acidobacteriaceae bacterium]